jgi:mRNA interferase MazF
VRVPFPYVERDRREVRPAVVLSRAPVGGEAHLIWCVMITSAANRGWPDDIPLEDRFAECGLKVPCLIRTAKIATIEASRAERVGSLPEDIRARLMVQVARQLGLAE